MSPNFTNNLDDNRPIPCKTLKKPLNELLNTFGIQSKQEMLEELKTSGINLDDESASYSINQVRQYFHLIFGDNGADLLTNVLRNALARTEM